MEGLSGAFCQEKGANTEGKTCIYFQKFTFFKYQVLPKLYKVEKH